VSKGDGCSNCSHVFDGPGSPTTEATLRSNPKNIQTMTNPRMSVTKAGDRVRHTTFGEGLVTKCESTSGDVKVTITFDSNNKVRQFLLSHTPMEKIGEYKAPPEKIKEPTEKIQEPKAPRTYTTAFKIEVVKQALSEGRAVVRKQYKLPETTLRGWIKELG